MRWLRLAVHFSARSQREIEIRSGFSRGYLSQILGGRVDIKVWHLLVILDAIETSPVAFFSQLFPGRRRRAREALQGPCLGQRGFDEIQARELARLFSYGLECLQDLDRRLARCEDALAEFDSSGIFQKS